MAPHAAARQHSAAPRYLVEARRTVIFNSCDSFSYRMLVRYCYGYDFCFFVFLIYIVDVMILVFDLFGFISINFL